MNLREGSRRLALFLGLLGFVAGCAVSAYSLMNMRGRWSDHPGLLLFPIMWFLAPWIATRVVTWVALGFIKQETTAVNAQK